MSTIERHWEPLTAGDKRRRNKFVADCRKRIETIADPEIVAMTKPILEDAMNARYKHHIKSAKNRMRMLLSRVKKAKQAEKRRNRNAMLAERKRKRNAVLAERRREEMERRAADPKYRIAAEARDAENARVKAEEARKSALKAKLKAERQRKAREDDDLIHDYFWLFKDYAAQGYEDAYERTLEYAREQMHAA